MIVPQTLLHDIDFLLAEAQSEIAILKANPDDDPQLHINRVYDAMNRMWLVLEAAQPPSRVNLSLVYTSGKPS